MRAAAAAGDRIGSLAGVSGRDRLGATATGTNAVSMLAVVRQGRATGRASALVSLGFFAGFVIGPTGIGVLAEHAGLERCPCR
jgi:hypothetical protein